MWGEGMLKAIKILNINARTVQIKPSQKPRTERCFSTVILLGLTIHSWPSRVSRVGPYATPGK